MTKAKEKAKKPTRAKAKDPRVKASGKPSGAEKAAAMGRALVPQPHGGALLPGAGGGPQPGGGRPASAIRARLRGAFDERIAKLESIADGKVEVELHHTCPKCGHEPDPANVGKVQVRTVLNDIRGAIDLMAKYGLGTQDQVTLVDDEVRSRLARQVEVITHTLPAGLATALLDALEQVWQ